MNLESESQSRVVKIEEYNDDVDNMMKDINVIKSKSIKNSVNKTSWIKKEVDYTIKTKTKIND